MKSLIKLIKYILYFFSTLFVLGLVAVVAIYLYLAPGIPSIETLKDVQLQVPLQVYSQDQRLIAEFGEKHRKPLQYNQIPAQVIQAFLAAEDDRFFEHPGVDYQGLLRAAFQLVMTGQRRQGGSTITMQVARNFFLSSKKTYSRKLNEIILALKIESLLSKQEILELYLNKIYLGHRSYGVGAASYVYYGKPIEKLNLAQVAMIAGLPKAPSRFNPITDPERAVIRRNYVLGRMLELSMISQNEHDEAKGAPVSANLHHALSEVDAPYVAEMARAEAVSRFGDDAYTHGYMIYTTVDSHLQNAANKALQDALQSYDKRHGFKGIEAHLEGSADEWREKLMGKEKFAQLKNAVVAQVYEKSAELMVDDGQTLTLDWSGLSWARQYRDQDHLGPAPKTADEILKPGDLIRIYPEQKEDGSTAWRLAQTPEVSGALVSVASDTGAVLALVGGYDFSLSKFNRAVQAKRQPGSGFKPFIYSAALENGFTAATLINDAPVVFDDPSMESAWRPENYSGQFFGPTRLRYALTQSRNLVSIRILRKLGIKYTLDYISRFGFNPEDLPHDLSLSLGSGAITPMQMAEGYVVLSNGGYHIKPYFIQKITDNQSQSVFEASPLIVCTDTEPNSSKFSQENEPELTNKCAEQVITPQNHYLMNSMMRDVVQFGTATKAKALGRKDIAGKTGTTNDQRDAWFNGFNRRIVTITWVGFDDFKALGRGEVGGRTAIPAWIDFMRVALENQPEELPAMPPGMVTVRIDADTGKPVGANSKNAIFEIFKEEDAPTGPNDTGSDTSQARTVEPLGTVEDPF